MALDNKQKLIELLRAARKATLDAKSQTEEKLAWARLFYHLTGRSIRFIEIDQIVYE